MRTGRLMTALGQAALVAVVLAMAAPEAWALGKCKARMKKKDGTIAVNAQGVTGTLRWGWEAGMEVFSFDNEASCQSGGAAKNCTLAPEGDPLRMTPPPMCTVYMEDDTDACFDYIAGCVPGSRPTCPPDMEQIGSWCVDRVGTYPVEFNDAVASCQAKGRSLCPLEAMIECDANRNGANYPAKSCAAFTDGQTSGWVWTITSTAQDDQNFFSYMTVYQDDNKANVQSTGSGSQYGAFCCTRLAGN